MTDHEDPIVARAALIGTADLLRTALGELNLYGDTIAYASGALTTQRDGAAWGEVYDGLKILIEVLFPGDTADLTDILFDSDFTLTEAAAHLAELRAYTYRNESETSP